MILEAAAATWWSTGWGEATKMLVTAGLAAAFTHLAARRGDAERRRDWLRQERLQASTELIQRLVAVQKGLVSVDEGRGGIQDAIERVRLTAELDTVVALGLIEEMVGVLPPHDEHGEAAITALGVQLRYALGLTAVPDSADYRRELKTGRVFAPLNAAATQARRLREAQEQGKSN